MIKPTAPRPIDADGPHAPHRSPVRRAAALLLAGTLGLATGARPAGAAIVLVSSSGSTTYSTRSVEIQIGTSESGTPTYTNNVLTSIPGFFVPGPPPEGPQLTQTQSFNSMATTQSFAADPSKIGSSALPFGAGSTSLTAFSSGTIAAGATSRSGLNWSSTFVSTPDGSFPGEASVSVTTATATFRNNSSTAVSGTVGASLALSGVLDSTLEASFVAASLTTSITTLINNISAVVAVKTIYFGYGFDTFGEQGPFFQTAQDGSVYNNSTLSLYSYKYTGAVRSGTVTFGLNDGYTVTSTLTMIADPASIALTNITNPEAIAELPDFGSFATNPVSLGPDTNAVPEPGTLAAALLGLAGAAIGLARRTRTKSA